MTLLLHRYELLRLIEFFERRRYKLVSAFALVQIVVGLCLCLIHLVVVDVDVSRDYRIVVVGVGVVACHYWVLMLVFKELRDVFVVMEICFWVLARFN